jgi:hypothetical protein
MAIPQRLPDKLSSRFIPPLMRGILTYCDFSDITPSRFLQRAAENELRRRLRDTPRLKYKLEKLLKEIEKEEQLRYGKPNPNSSDGK